MLLCYMHRTGNEERPDLCLIADKPDQFSVPVSVDSLLETHAACIRLGPNEGVNVERDPQDGGTIIVPVKPSMIFMTPNQPDIPGIRVLGVKIVRTGEGGYKTYFRQDKPEWREWDALRDSR